MRASAMIRPRPDDRPVDQAWAVWSRRLLIACVLLVGLWPALLTPTQPELWRRCLMLAGALLTLLLMLGSRARNPALSDFWLRILLAAHLLAVGLSSAIALHPTVSLFGGAQRGLGLLSELAWWLLVLAAAQVAGSGGCRSLLGWIARIGTALSIWALADFAVAASWGYRSSAALGNPAFLASFLALTLPLQALVHPSRRWTLALVLLQTMALLSSGGRAALLGALIGGLALAFWRLPPTRTWQRWVSATLLIGLMVAALAWRPASVAIRGELYQASLSAMLTPDVLVHANGSPDRWASWRPLLGHGPDAIEPALTRHRSARLNSAALEASGWDRWADRSHSRPLDRLLEGGLIGLIVAGALGLTIARRLATAVRRESAMQAPQTGERGLEPLPVLVAMLLIWLIDGLFSVPSAAADLVAAIALGAALQLSAAAQTERERSATRRFDAAWAILLIAPVCAVSLALGSAHQALLGSGDAASADPGPALRTQPYSALPVIQALQQALSEAHPARQLPQLRRWSEHVVTAAPSVPRAWLLHGQVSELLGDPQAAARAWTKGLSLLRPGDTALTPQQRLLTAVALSRSADQLSAAGAANDAEAAYRAARQALEIASPPNSAAWWATLAWLRAREGDRSGAILAYQQTLRINPDDVASQRNLEQLQQTP